MSAALSAISLRDSVVALHVAAAVVGFGVIFAYPLMHAVVRRDVRALPALHRAQLELARWLTTPALGLVVLAGIYLASEEHQWKSFYVQWGVGTALLLGAVWGAFIVPQEKRLIALLDRDGAGSGGAEVALSAEYQRLSGRVKRVAMAASLLVLVTVYLMANHVGASGYVSPAGGSGQ